MQKSTTRIRTSHVGRLPPPKGWEDMPARLANAEVIDGGEIASHVVPAIAETVKKQVEIGIDCINDGEFWTARSLAHYAAHFTGLEARPVKLGEPPTTRHSTRERDEFRDFYADMDKLGTLFFVPGEKPMPPMTERVIARGSVKSRGPQAINREIDAFNTRHQYLAGRHLDRLPGPPFVLMSHVAGLEGIGLRLNRENQIDDVFQRQVVSMRTVPAAPTEVVTHLLFRNADERVIDCFGAQLGELAVLFHGRLGLDHVPPVGKARIVDLQHETRRNHRAVFFAHGLSQGEQKLFIGVVVFIENKMVEPARR